MIPIPEGESARLFKSETLFTLTALAISLHVPLFIYLTIIISLFSSQHPIEYLLPSWPAMQMLTSHYANRSVKCFSRRWLMEAPI